MMYELPTFRAKQAEIIRPEFMLENMRLTLSFEMDFINNQTTVLIRFTDRQETFNKNKDN